MKLEYTEPVLAVTGLVENKDPSINANEKYMCVVNELGEELLYTKFETERARNRGKKNPEDLIDLSAELEKRVLGTPGFLTRVREVFAPTNRKLILVK